MLATLRADTWLSTFLGRDAYALQIHDSIAPAECNELAASLAEKGKIFAFAKLPTTDTRGVAQLEALGFRLVDTSLQFEMEAGLVAKGKQPGLARNAKPADRAAVAEIARRSFRFSRFHLDPKMPERAADEIKAAWVDNFFLGRRGDWMVVGERDGTVSGFNQLLRSEDGAITIDLIAVGEAYRGGGVAEQMIEFAAKSCGAPKTIRVGTQAANIPSVRLYERIGFRLRSSSYVLHYWS